VTGSSHFSFDIKPTVLNELYTYRVTLKIYNKDGKAFDGPTFKIYLF